MTPSLQSSNFKPQTSEKFQISKFKLWCLVFGVSLIFDVWLLNFASGGGV